MFTKIFTCLFLCLSALLSATQLFHAGATDWRIWLSPQAGQVEAYAAEELQTTLKQISGADFRIVRSQAPAKSKDIVIASPASWQAMPDFLNIPQSDSEELVNLTRNGNLYLCGNSPRAALYAVYAFLRRELDVRWYWPGEDGTFISAKQSHTLPQMDWHDRPAFRFREMTPCDWHLHVPSEIWMARNFLNGGSRTPAIRAKGGFYRADGAHSVSISKDMFAEHPDWFAMINGKRVPEGIAGCWSNPDFTRYLVQKHVELIRKRNMELVNAFPADTIPRCECPECTKNPDPSSRWYDYYAKLIREIRKQCPETMFAGIAYQEYRTVPATKVQNLEYVEYCQYNRCYIHRLDDPTCELNRKSMDELKRWQAKAPMGVYGYEFDIFRNSNMVVPFWNMLQDEMKTYRDMKLVRMKTELWIRHSHPHRDDIPQIAMRLANYIYAQLVWNPDLNMDQLLQDFSRHVYGPGADHILAYHRRMAKAWDAMKHHVSYFWNAPAGTARFLLSESMVKQTKQDFALALKATEGKDFARNRREILLEQTLFNKWLKLYQASHDNSAVATLHLMSDSPENFPKVGRLPMKTRKGTSKPTEARMFWSKEALHIQVIAWEPDMKSLKKGASGVPDIQVWHDDNVEIFLSPSIGDSYRHLGANLAGGTYDAINTDENWNPKWQATTTFEKDRWIMNIRIPFASLELTPRAGDMWQIVLMRNSQPNACGFPKPAYHDLSAAATIYFSPEARPDKRLAWIGSPDFKANKNLQAILYEFTKNNWQSQGAIGVKDARKLDFQTANLIIIETYKNRFPLEFYRDQLIPAVKNGAVVIFSSYYWLENLQRDFNDPTYQVKTIQHPDPTRKTTAIIQDSFATTPHDMVKGLWHTPYTAFIPAHPQAWTNLAYQKMSDGKTYPYLIARPLGKGMVVLGGDMSRNIKALENLFQYNHTIKR